MSAREAGRVVAFDPGSTRIGVAVCSAERSMAFPRAALPAGEGTAARCAAVVREEGATVVVVGLPLRLDGSEGPEARTAREFAAALDAELAGTVEVVLHDERLTTVTAARRLRDVGHRAPAARSRVDGASAVVLLESWLAT